MSEQTNTPINLVGSLQQQIQSPPKAQQSPLFVFNRQFLENRIKEITTYHQSFVGKPNHNPFVWIAKYLSPLYNRLTGNTETPPEETQELHNEIMSLELEPPIVIPFEDEQPKETPKIILGPTGAQVQKTGNDQGASPTPSQKFKPADTSLSPTGLPGKI